MPPDDKRLQKMGRLTAQLRQNLGWTQGQLSDNSGADRSQVSRLEAGERLVAAPVLARIAHALGTTTDELLVRAGYATFQTGEAETDSLRHLGRLLDHYPVLQAIVESWPHMTAEQRARLRDQWMFEQVRDQVHRYPGSAAAQTALQRVAASRVGRRDEDVDPTIAQAMEQAVRDFEAYMDTLYPDIANDPPAPPVAAAS